MTRKLRDVLLTLFIVCALNSSQVAASTHDFYKGKTIRIVVGFSAGGGFDIFSRTIARHMGNHIPGSPNFMIQNMTGAGSLIAANHVYTAAKRDGLTIGNFIGGLIMQELLGRRGIKFEAFKFRYLGVPERTTQVCAFTKASGISSVEKWLSSGKRVKLAGTAPGSSTDDIPKILRNVLGFPLRVIEGYRGAPQMLLAAQRGEVDGICGLSWTAVRATWGQLLQSGDAVVVLQMLADPDPNLPDVPVVSAFAKRKEARQLVKAGIINPANLTRIYALAPGTPKERVRILRKAFMDTMKDPEFLADAKKSKLTIDPLSGEKVQEIVADLFELDPTLVRRLKEVLE